VLSFSAAHELVVLAFPVVNPGKELCNIGDEFDYDFNWCQEMLLSAPWPDITLDTLLRSRECPIYLSHEQLAFCLPAYLDAALLLVKERNLDYLNDCLMFLQLTVYDTSIVIPQLNVSQRDAISAVLEIIAGYFASIGESDDSQKWQRYASWWSTRPGS